ncbi:MAG: hypothetical protein Q7S56_04145 [Nanoarchaeota archaeon]|nr:hypothetical protein [Nanoarchaeota archaeon]
MRITLNIDKRYAYSIIGLLILVIGLLAVNAYTSDLKAGALPSSFGHSVNEIEGTARASYVGCPTNTLPTGWSPNDFICGAATLYNSNSNVKINEQGICFGTNCKTAWDSSLIAVSKIDSVSNNAEVDLPSFTDASKAVYSKCSIAVNPQSVRFDDYTSDSSWKTLKAYAQQGSNVNKAKINCRFEWASPVRTDGGTCQVQIVCTK